MSSFRFCYTERNPPKKKEKSSESKDAPEGKKSADKESTSEKPHETVEEDVFSDRDKTDDKEEMSSIVYLHVIRKKTNVFLELKEQCPLLEVKRMLQGILKVAPQNQRLSFIKHPDELRKEAAAAAAVEAASANEQQNRERHEQQDPTSLDTDDTAVPDKEEEEEVDPASLEKDMEDDGQALRDYGITADLAKPQCPIELALVFRDPETGEFEQIQIEPVSKPSALPQDDEEAEDPRRMPFHRMFHHNRSAHGGSLRRGGSVHRRL